jgi:hypothetical protein
MYTYACLSKANIINAFAKNSRLSQAMAVAEIVKNQLDRA